MGLFEVFLGTLEVTLPVFAMVFVGLVLKRLGWIDAAFIATASSLVFKVTMPVLLFLSIVRADLAYALQPGLIGYFLAVSVLGFFAAWGWARLRYPREEIGVFVQGAFRGNVGIVGLALAASMYGDHGLSLGGIMAGSVIVVYNVLSSIVLALYSPSADSDLRSLLLGLLRNPLILSVMVALPVAFLALPLPAWLVTSGEYLGSLSLPLALICIGGTLGGTAIRHDGRQALYAGLWKLVWLPLAGTVGAFQLGYRDAELGILFLFLASPTAAVAFVMAKAYGANERMTASIIMLTTFGSMLTISLGVFVLKIGGAI
ncbi:AEC family transporter [Halomonas sp. EGI 63088]|uniref:AEC family transporter n=1 Tax=Halomonas flagellata TaxID=2920385 RepID=A0ABS9S065_9GAMM|nr:AEC family transporter [Halomonas flagellata]MCH4565503.1 AEC family transporter [Halomonas flagellata]